MDLSQEELALLTTATAGHLWEIQLLDDGRIWAGIVHRDTLDTMRQRYFDDLTAALRWCAGSRLYMHPEALVLRSAN